MRIGTWNLDGKWSNNHAGILEALDCDIWLLTEVAPAVSLGSFRLHRGSTAMNSDRHWAGVLARDRFQFEPIADPHPASAACLVDGLVTCASVLPWPRAGELWPWGSHGHVERMRETVQVVTESLSGQPAIWGGDWNTPLAGNLAGFVLRAQTEVLSCVERLGLQVPTTHEPHRNDVQKSIDHIGVPTAWTVKNVGFRRVTSQLSDHDAYWIELD